MNGPIDSTVDLVGGFLAELEGGAKKKCRSGERKVTRKVCKKTSRRRRSMRGGNIEGGLTVAELDGGAKKKCRSGYRKVTRKVCRKLKGGEAVEAVEAAPVEDLVGGDVEAVDALEGGAKKKRRSGRKGSRRSAKKRSMRKSKKHSKRSHKKHSKRSHKKRSGRKMRGGEDLEGGAVPALPLTVPSLYGGMVLADPVEDLAGGASSQNIEGGKKCRSGKVRNQKTGRCRKCPSGQVRSRKSKHCRSKKAARRSYRK